jgi:hypothetical protein
MVHTAAPCFCPRISGGALAGEGRLEVLIDHDARALAPEKPSQHAFATFDRLAPQVLAVQLDQVEGA